MNPEQKLLLAAILKELAPNELRVVKYEVSGGHSCNRSTSLTTCCGVSRCQSCHIPHLKEKHTIEQLHAYEKFVSAVAMTWQVRDYKLPLPPKKATSIRTKANKKPVLQVKETPRDLANSLKDDDLEQMIALLSAKLRK